MPENKNKLPTKNRWQEAKPSRTIQALLEVWFVILCIVFAVSLFDVGMGKETQAHAACVLLEQRGWTDNVRYQECCVDKDFLADDC